ncbi:malto-oligosyltrehalose synthase [Sphingobium sp. BHU LFT2]|uniref:malto-oligosyltrehalose synthase n=1 Tax=Sphingobium sp. BHU LFT2 TaxID=2807634 RepID=UPI001BEC6AB4|nr:malto-oligosyltrehalose synthase [Sphingobium sp. BHU LFT2]MBT2245110.1 malto-oligosyltrehalose synthase [Sphingobium sp. BHU LFT2]
MTLRATYRVQLTKEFPFAAAQKIIPYLAQLGISHLYASPITTARQGSTHGYDVIDPTRINPELGGEAGFQSLVATLRAHEMGIIIDIVPNHMGVAGGENLWWNDVLRLGSASPFAHYFDIDWNSALALPILGEPLSDVLAQGNLALGSTGEPHLLLYGEHKLPLRPDGPQQGDIATIVEAQHYALKHWRAAGDELNWRRFFSINDLAGIRVEDPEVFEATHSLYFRLYQDGLIDGLRIDHVDGLSDPARYCRQLRSRMDQIRPGATILVEKILGPRETLSADWGVEGTTGYDFMRDVMALLHEPNGEKPLSDLWTVLEPDQSNAQDVIRRAKRDMLEWQFEAQLSGCVDAFRAVAQSSGHAAIMAWTKPMFRRAISGLLQTFPVYRTYGDGQSAPASDEEARSEAWEAAKPYLPPGEQPVAQQILAWLAGDGPGVPDLAAEAVRRFQQLSAPIAAKGVEDTAFYRRAPLLSANEVGSAPGEFAISPAEFHRRACERASNFPAAMLASATHDHKRGEDNRARIAVLSGVPELWADYVQRWNEFAVAHHSDIHPADRYQLFQTLLGTWDGSGGSPAYNDRILAWQKKALREARLRSSWEEPCTHYEEKAAHLACGLVNDPGFRDDIERLLGLIEPAARVHSLVQTVLKFCLPGVPDIYQGCELEDLSLVDPDNRRPVDYTLRQTALASNDNAGNGKLHLIRRLLTMRRDNPSLFSSSCYDPVLVQGQRAGSILAFTRSGATKRLTCAVLIRAADPIIASGCLPSSHWWQDTYLLTPRPVAARQMFAHHPFYIRLDPLSFNQ